MTTKHAPPRRRARHTLSLRARHTLSLLGLFAALLGCAGAAFASGPVVHVPGDFATIQAAINSASSGDTVEVADGTYTGPGNTDLDTGGKNVTIKSVHGAASTIIDCGGSASHRGFSVHSGESVTVSGLTVQNAVQNSNGQADSGYGGAVYVTNGTILLHGCVLTGCTAQHRGAGVYCGSGGSATLQNCVVSNNSGYDGGGGLCAASGTLTLTGCTVSGNATQSGGGGLLNYYGTVTLTGCTFSANTAANGGGGVLGYYGTLALTDCVLSGNTAAAGGGVYGYDDAASLARCTVSGNTTTGTDGGGGVLLYRDNGGAATLMDCVVWGNSTSADGGGLYLESNSQITMTGTTVTANSGGRGSGVFVGIDPGGAATLTGCLLWGDAGTELVADPASAAPPVCEFCDVQGGFAGTGNINADPVFVSPANDFHLQQNSPCRGAGSSAGTSATDRDGTARLNPPSVGAYEAPALTSITVAPAAPSVTVGATDQFTATAHFSDSTTSDVTAQATWASDDTGKVTVNAAGLATGVAAGSANIKATYNGVTSSAAVLTVTAPAAPPVVSGYQALWSKSDGSFSLWNVALGGAFDPHDFDAAPGFAAQAIADTPDGHVHILLTAANGTVQFDDANQSALTRFHNSASTALSYGPFSGWTAHSLAAGPDGLLRVLWTRTDGMLSLWKLHADGTYTHAEYGPYAGWTARLMSVAHDNTVRILWTKTDGQMSFWVMDAQGGYAHTEYGPYAGWTPTALTTAAAGQNLVSWTRASDSKLSLWALSDSGQFSFVNFGPFAGWTASSLTVGADSTLHVGWTQASGAASLWDLSSMAFQYSVYGPYSAWHLQGLSAAP